MHRDARSDQRWLQLAQGLLPGAQHDRVRLHQVLALVLLAERDDQSLGCDPLVVDARDHRHALGLQGRPMDPARGLAQARTELAGLALQERDLSGSRGRVRGSQTATHLVGIGDAPFLEPLLEVHGGGLARLDCEVLGHVESDAARADDRNALAHRHALGQDVQVADHVRAVLARDARVAWGHAGGQDHLVDAESLQVLGGGPGREVQAHAGVLDPVREVAQRLAELLLPGDLLGQVELSADLVG